MDPQLASTLPSQHKDKIIGILIAAICMLGIICILVYLLLASNAKQISTKQLFVSSPTPALNTSVPLPAPIVHFAAYKNNATMPIVPTGLNIYTLKNSYAASDVESFMQKFNLHSAKKISSNYFLANTTQTKEDNGLLIFYDQTGTFDYQSSGVFTSANYSSGQAVQDEALSTLHDIGIADATISCPITYAQKPFTTVTSVECHRDWQKIGLPIYNIVGLLNTPISQPLASFALGNADGLTPVDTSITDVKGVGPAERNNGRKRPNDYNTATVQIAPDGHVLSIVSNLRQVLSAQPIVSTEFVSPSDALQEFYNQKAIFSLVIPSGAGTIDWQKIFQHNQAFADTATITDFTLAYVEKPADIAQSYLVPMYIIRGTATLKTGYEVSFVQAISALRSNQSFLTSIQPVAHVAAAQTQNVTPTESNAQLQLKTFDVSPQPSVTVTSTPEAGRPSSTPTPATSPSTPLASCQLPSSAQSVVIQVPGMGSITFFNPDGTNKDSAAHGIFTHAFYYSSSSFPVASLQDAKDALYTAVEDQYVINVAYHLTQEDAGDLHTQSTLADIKAEFNKINSGHDTGVNYLSRPAPYYNGAGGAGSVGVYDQQMNLVADHVAQKILTAVQNNQVANLIQPDIFSSSTIRNLEYIFISLTDNSYSPDPADQACYITGASPVLFFYPQQKMNISVSLYSTTFNQPPATNNTWNVIAYPNGTLGMNGIAYPYLYYEYSKNIIIDYKNNGVEVSSSDWKREVTNIAHKLDLNSQETSTLLTEVQNALFGQVTRKYIIISLANQSELNKKLPLRTTPPDNKTAETASSSAAFIVFFSKTSTIAVSNDAHKSYNVCFCFSESSSSKFICCQPTFACGKPVRNVGKCSIVKRKNDVFKPEKEKS